MRLRCFLLLSLLLASALSANEGVFLLLLGPSGVGKSTIIEQLQEMDSRFEYISPFVTRPLRPGESSKIHVSEEELWSRQSKGEILTVNQIYGIYYATPKSTIDHALEKEHFPVLDWPADKMQIMLQTYGDRLFVVYLEPDSIEELQRRLELDGRDKDGQRFARGKEELERYWEGKYDAFIDMKAANSRGNSQQIAKLIYERMMDMIHSSRD